MHACRHGHEFLMSLSLSAYRCDADIKGSKYIPIIVGGVLAGLVAIVFVAYIVGRLRNHRQALYEKIDS